VSGSYVRLRSAPTPALVLGLAGLFPFLSITAIVAGTESPLYAWWIMSLAQYAAVILAFIGALHWGYAMRSELRAGEAWLRYGWSVIPALIGWLALQFPVWTALRIEAGALLLCLATDRAFARAYGAPAWLLPLRFILTSVAAASLLVARVC